MPPKKKKAKKDKKEKGKDQNTLTQVDRTFYELTITDLNNKLSRLRSHCAKLEGSNDDLNEKMRQFEEDRTDVTAYLDRQLGEKMDIIREMDERLVELAKVREEENKKSMEKLKDWELKFKAMHEQLTSEIKLLNGKLNSLEEFRVHKADLLLRFDEQEAEMKEQRRIHQEKIHEMEQKAIIEKDQLKKTVEANLLRLSEDFTKSSEIRIAGYTRRLIRENIALNKEMDRMVASQIRMEAENKRMKDRDIEIEQLYASSEIVKERLVKTCQNQIKIIEDLTHQYEILQTKYQKITHYKKLYETSLKKDVCDQFSYNEMTKKLRILAQRVEMLKSDKQKLISFHQQHEAEIIRLNKILKTIKFTVQSAIRGEIDDSDDPEFRKVQRKNLLTELMQVLTSYSEEHALTPSVSSMSEAPIYRPGVAGFMPKTAASLFELFKREARKIASAELISPAFKAKALDDKITPKPRSVEGESIIDVESGSTIIFSSTTEEEDAPPVEGGLEDEQGDMGASSSSERRPTPVESKPAVSPKVETKVSVRKEREKKKVIVETVVDGDKQDGKDVVKKVSKVSLAGEEEHQKAPSIEEYAEEESAVFQDIATEIEGEEEEEDDAAYFFY